MAKPFGWIGRRKDPFSSIEISAKLLLLLEGPLAWWFQSGLCEPKISRIYKQDNHYIKKKVTNRSIELKISSPASPQFVTNWKADYYWLLSMHCHPKFWKADCCRLLLKHCHRKLCSFYRIQEHVHSSKTGLRESKGPTLYTHNCTSFKFQVCSFFTNFYFVQFH